MWRGAVENDELRQECQKEQGYFRIQNISDRALQEYPVQACRLHHRSPFIAALREQHPDAEINQIRRARIANRPIRERLAMTPRLIAASHSSERSTWYLSAIHEPQTGSGKLRPRSEWIVACPVGDR
jgi:hypothetical protein